MLMQSEYQGMFVYQSSGFMHLKECPPYQNHLIFVRKKTLLHTLLIANHVILKLA